MRRNVDVAPGVFEGTYDVANHESAEKAYRQSLVNRDRNRQYRSRLRTALKGVRAAIAGGKSAEVKASLGDTVSLIDKMAGKGIIHRNAAGRYKSRLMAKLGA
jgi:small subunit ribosomal protein S20